MIKTSTKIFATAPLLLLALSEILTITGDSASQSFLWMAYIAMVVLMFDLIVENKKAAWLYSCILVLILLAEIGDLFKIMHWPLSALMILGGLFGSFLMAGIFFYNATKDGGYHIKHEQLILSVCVFIQMFLAILFSIHYNSFVAPYTQFIYYPMAVICGVILLKRKYVNLGERNLVLYLLINSLFTIIIHAFKLLK
ncbi:MAG TPA: hypothetical protein VK796_11195 [Cytophaga sp.]|jgi:hypothetical protein|nr:hypothetical protein [Cytophaga sp.]